MIAPNKVVTLRESALGLTPTILEEGPSDIPLSELLDRVTRRNVSLTQFMLALDILYVLDRITVDFDSGVVSYAS